MDIFFDQVFTEYKNLERDYAEMSHKIGEIIKAKSDIIEEKNKQPSSHPLKNEIYQLKIENEGLTLERKKQSQISSFERKSVLYELSCP
jgi:predicted nuclease with TOPRIM domain